MYSRLELHRTTYLVHNKWCSFFLAKVTSNASSTRFFLSICLLPPPSSIDKLAFPFSPGIGEGESCKLRERERESFQFTEDCTL